MQTQPPLEASQRPELSSDEANSDTEDNQAFSEVLALIQHEKIAAFCIETRGRIEPSFTDQFSSAQKQTATLEPIIFGSYHAVFPVKFEDGVRWVLKVSAVGTRDQFGSSSAAALKSEALTMRLIRKNTTISVPEVFSFDCSVGNILGVPFILMSFAEGVSAYDVWFDKTIVPETLQTHRSQILRDVAAAMVQLDQFAFKAGGAPIFGEDGSITDIGPMRSVDNRRMIERLDDDNNDSEMPLYYTSGPFFSPQEFYQHVLDGEEPDPDPFVNGIKSLLQLFLSWVPDCQTETPFVISHPDLNFQNILVSSEGRLQSLIDWDDVVAVPRSIGNENLPSFLTRDWDPAMYAWNEDMERGVEPRGCWEDSPETLQRHRREYQAYISSASGGEGAMTNLSLYVQNLVFAAGDTIVRFDIVKKFVDEIVPLALDLAEPDDRKKLAEQSDVFDIAMGLVEGTLEQSIIELLRRGFEALLSRA
ncbi:hypothetical protein E8E13_009115 [Curvularia kusanoi]|uniref:Aminoglycoside phosphotransferase domain-containing protein n=1 Tax=Curvularia kusanoi TaxID=90978 RepID=A0A9P4W9U4_CURKU|nr:hypothetical protein E8E13_009115 [Curvularia kusanoi]